MTFKTLISEDGTTASMGRAAFWILLGLASYFWICKLPAEFPPTLYSILTGVLLYNFGKKGLETVTNYFDLKAGAAKV